MKRRSFLMGLGTFAGSALVLPRRTIFDMGRGLVTPAPAPLIGATNTSARDYLAQWDAEHVASFMLGRQNEVYSAGRATMLNDGKYHPVYETRFTEDGRVYMREAPSPAQDRRWQLVIGPRPYAPGTWVDPIRGAFQVRRDLNGVPAPLAQIFNDYRGGEGV